MARRVDWNGIHDAYGSARAVPRLLRSACSTDASVRRRARAELSDRLVHQGALSDAALAAIPVVLEHLASPHTPGRACLAPLLVELATGTPDEYLRGRDLGELSGGSDALAARMGSRYARLAKRCFSAAQRARPAALDLLAATARRDRIAGAYMLTFLVPWTAPVLERVRRALASERDPHVAAGLLLCLGFGSRWTAARHEASADLRTRVDDDASIVRGCAAIALAMVNRADDARDGLRAAMALRRAASFPWNHGHVAELAEAWLPETAASLGDVLGALARAKTSDEKAAHAARLASLAFPGGERGSKRSVSVDMPLYEELSADQRHALRAIAALDDDVIDESGIPAVLRRHGIPGTPDDLKRYVGLAPAGPLDRVIAATVAGQRVTWPLVRFYKRFALGSVSRADLVSALAAMDDVNACIDAVLESAGPYDLSTTGTFDWPTAARVGIDVLARREDARDPLERRLDAMRGVPDPGNRYATWILLGALARLSLERREPLVGRHCALLKALRGARIQMSDVLRDVTGACGSADGPSSSR